MPAFRLSIRAKIDLLEIARYTQREWGDFQAENYVTGLEEFCTFLANFPNLGRSREELAPNLKRMEYKSHVVFFVVAEDGIVVSRILHKSQDITSEEFEEFGEPL